MKTKTIIALLILSFLISCNKVDENYKLYVLFDNVEGVTAKSEVKSRGLKIGSVDNLQLFKEKVLVTVSIKNDVKIPIDSKFEIKSISLIGDNIISVTLNSDSEIFYKESDTINGEVEKVNKNQFFTDSINVNKKKIIDSIGEKIKRIMK